MQKPRKKQAQVPQVQQVTPNNPIEQKINLKPLKQTAKTFPIQKLMSFLVIVRFYIMQIPIYLFIVLLILVYFLKIHRQGNIPTSLFSIFACLCLVFGQIFKNGILTILAPIFCGCAYFLSYKIYWLPKVTSLIGFRQHVLQNDLYMMELYQVKKNQNLKQKIIYWNHRLQLTKMMSYANFQNAFIKKIAAFFMSAINKHRILYAQGDEQKPTNSKINTKAIIFSHGRTGTPLMYSQILNRLMSFSLKNKQNLSIFAVQHNQKKDTGQTQVPKMKKFRQIQVQARAAQVYSSIQFNKQKKQLILMGHSYGCATIIQTYHSLSHQQRKKLNCIILLDPWFFPLTKQKFQQKIKCPILILANQYFLSNQDVFNRNKKFLEKHTEDKVIYLIWKNGDHLHQTDLGFITGNIFNKVKRSDLSLQMINKNVQAMQIFISNPNITQQLMRQKFESHILQQSFKPLEFNNNLKF